MQIFPFKSSFNILVSHISDGDFRKNPEKSKNFLKKYIKNKKFCHITLEGGTKRYLCTNVLDKEIVADAVLTQNPDVCLSMVVADCLPIVIIDKKTKAMALVHAGWRGLENNILELTLKDFKAKFKTKTKDLVAWIGPGISACCYRMDIKKQAVEQLKRLDIREESISIDKTCTCCGDKYFSHQRSKKTGEPDGRFIIAIYQEGD